MQIGNREGKHQTAKVLVMEPFCAAYKLDSETGFLRYSAANNSLYALDKRPSRSMQKALIEYMQGEQTNVPVDIGRGAALLQLRYKLSLIEQIQSGGILVWPIHGVLFCGILIILECSFCLFRNYINGDRLMDKLASLLRAGQWDEAVELCRASK